MLIKSECPCCHGIGFVETRLDDVEGTPTIYFPCCHCDDGKIDVDKRIIEEIVQRKISEP